ncbi:major facilitator superfamily domain-containing protein [Mycena maculata]|uniref:Major facilitator superfamily domain-containing protein n=1 Tax=Mycena maculata TaxID=230809 RepID=A0AAD7NBK9_9AGAR|nr:major facilitator superfamily domain-containing protein [Mycena maculata]
MIMAATPEKVKTTFEASEPGPICLAEDVNHASAFPEGGFQAWATVAGAVLIQFCGIGPAELLRGFTRSHSHQQIYVLVWCISRFLRPGVLDPVVVFCNLAGYMTEATCETIPSALALFMLSLCKPEKYYQVFLAQGIGAGLGSGALYVPSVAVIAHYFKKRCALAMTIVASGSSLGATIHPIMLNNTLRSHLGFGNAVRASAGFISVLLLIACCLMHPRLPPSTTSPPFWKSLWRFGHDIPYVLATIALTAFMVGYFFPFFYLQLDAINHGLNETFSFYSLVILNASSCVGRLAPGAFASRFGVIEMVVFASGGGAALILSMIALRTVTSVVVIGILYGFFAGVFATLQVPVMAVLTEDMGELGLRIGVAFAVVGLGGLIGPPINGALLTSDYIWWRPALFSGVMAFTGFSFFVATLVAVRHRCQKEKECCRCNRARK